MELNGKQEDRQVFESEGISQKINVLRKKGQYMISQKIPFKLIRSGNAFDLVSGLYNQKAQRSTMSPKDMNFIQVVKREICKGDALMKYADIDFCNESISYMKVNDQFNIGDKAEDLLYIDINNAYWQTALNLGIISFKTYEKGLEKSKVVRLASLGSLAKKKEVWSFDGDSFYRENVQRSWETETLWFLICKKVSDLMEQVATELGDDFVFYWVDGIYVKNTHENFVKVSKIFMDAGYWCKSETAKSVEFRNYDFVVTGRVESDVKVFSYSVSAKKSKEAKSLLNNLKQKTKVRDSVLRALRGDFDNL